MNFKWGLWIILAGIFTQSTLWAGEYTALYRGARAQAMGNAFTAVADDDEAIFYNPAGLAGIQTLSLSIASANVEASDDMISNLNSFTGILNNPSASTINGLMGKDIYQRAQTTSTLVIPYFGIAAIGDEQVGLSLKNPAFPEGNLLAEGTYGTQFGFGVPLFKTKKKKSELRFGLAAKLLWRSGGYQALDLTEIMTLNSSSFNSLLRNFGFGFGMDAGLQYIYTFNKTFSAMAGLTMKDIGDTSFSGAIADPIKSDTTAGIAFRYSKGDLVATLAYDYDHLLDYIDWRLKEHIGLELKFPILSLYAGLSQLYPTYGVGIDLGPFRFMYLSYMDEQGYVYNQEPERRQMVQFSFKFNL